MAGSACTRLSVTPAITPVIVTNDRHPREVEAEAWAAIHRSNRPPVLFNRLGELAWVHEQEVEGKIIRGIAPMNVMAHYQRLTLVADWIRETEDFIQATSPPFRVAQTMTEVVDPSLPPLQSMVEGPVFDRQGNLICTPGYHREEALWMHLQQDFSLDPIPTDPSPDDLAWAHDQIFNELLVDFPFVDQADRAHTAAALVLPFIRRMIPGRTPIHLVEAPEAGSGKGYICQAVSILATGSEMIAATLPNDDDEIRKRLTSELTLGRPIIVLDNADDKKPLHSPSLASVITAETWTDRMLGQTNMVTVPNKAVWMMTGNNTRMSMEIARRSIRIRILSPYENPHLAGGYKHDPFPEWVKEERANLVRAVLIWVQAWIAAGKPLSSHRLGSFERWARTSGGIFQVVGIPGFLENLQDMYQSVDTDGESWREFVAAWWEEYKSEPIKVIELNDLCDRVGLLVGVRGDGTFRSQETRLGHSLRKHRDRIFHGKRIIWTGKDTHDKGNRYALIDMTADDDEGANPPNLSHSGDLLGFCGTLRNVENEVPHVGSAGDSHEDSDTYNSCGTLRNVKSNPNAGRENNSRICELNSAYTAADPKQMFRKDPQGDLTERDDRGNERGTSQQRIRKGTAEVPQAFSVIDLADFQDDHDER